MGGWAQPTKLLSGRLSRRGGCNKINIPDAQPTATLTLTEQVTQSWWRPMTKAFHSNRNTEIKFILIDRRGGEISQAKQSNHDQLTARKFWTGGSWF